METNDVFSRIIDSLQSEYNLVKESIEKGLLISSTENKEPGLVELMNGRHDPLMVSNIIDSYHIEAINKLITEAETLNSSSNKNTVYVKKAGTIDKCVNNLHKWESDEIIIVGIINRFDINWIREQSIGSKLRTLNLYNTVIEFELHHYLVS